MDKIRRAMNLCRDMQRRFIRSYSRWPRGRPWTFDFVVQKGRVIIKEMEPGGEKRG